MGRPGRRGGLRPISRPSGRSTKPASGLGPSGSRSLRQELGVTHASPSPLWITAPRLRRSVAPAEPFRARADATSQCPRVPPNQTPHRPSDIAYDENNCRTPRTANPIQMRFCQPHLKLSPNIAAPAQRPLRRSGLANSSLSFAARTRATPRSQAPATLTGLRGFSFETLPVRTNSHHKGGHL
jgi:hypothetical protein